MTAQLAPFVRRYQVDKLVPLLPGMPVVYRIYELYVAFILMRSAECLQEMGHEISIRSSDLKQTFCIFRLKVRAILYMCIYICIIYIVQQFQYYYCHMLCGM